MLRRRQAGQSARRIARETGLDRKTVGRYLAQAGEHGIGPEATVSEDVAAIVGKRVQARPATPPSEAWLTLVGRRDQISGWLGGAPSLRKSSPCLVLT